MPNSLPIGSGISRPTMLMATGTGCPARRLRTMMLSASGNWAANRSLPPPAAQHAQDDIWQCGRAKQRSQRPLEEAAAEYYCATKATTLIVAIMTTRRANPIVIPDCKISRLSVTRLSRKLPLLVSPRSRRNATRTLSRSAPSFDSLRRLLIWLRYDAGREAQKIDGLDGQPGRNGRRTTKSDKSGRNRTP